MKSRSRLRVGGAASAVDVLEDEDALENGGTLRKTPLHKKTHTEAAALLRSLKGAKSSCFQDSRRRQHSWRTEAWSRRIVSGALRWGGAVPEPGSQPLLESTKRIFVKQTQATQDRKQDA